MTWMSYFKKELRMIKALKRRLAENVPILDRLKLVALLKRFGCLKLKAILLNCEMLTDKQLMAVTNI